MPRARAAGVARIAVVGESSAYMLGNSLRELIAQRPCGQRYELLACGQPGSALEHLERRFDEVLTYRPDAVVVVFGHNLQFRFSMDVWPAPAAARSHGSAGPSTTPATRRRRRCRRGSTSSSASCCARAPRRGARACGSW
jgi:hypothetical protein